MPVPFSHDWLRDFLAHLSAHYPVVPLGEWDGSRAALLRHDVDLALGPALSMACLEHQCGLRSTFFVMTSSPTYNPFSSENRGLLREILELGSEVGLHFDPQVYAQEDLAAAARWEAGCLAEAVGRPVRCLSLHNPHRSGSFPLIEGFRNAYDPRIFGPDRYLSDSCRRFHHDPFEFVARARPGPLQVLLHPLHYTPDGQDYPGIFRAYLGELLRQIDRSFRPVNPAYDRTVQPGLEAWLPG